MARPTAPLTVQALANLPTQAVNSLPPTVLPPPTVSGPVGLNPDFTNRIGDTDLNGTPDVITASPGNFIFSSGNFLPWLQPADDRGVMEFNIANLSGTLTSATLQMDLIGSSGVGVSTVTFDIVAYAADGIASLADFNSGVVVASHEFPTQGGDEWSAYRLHSIPLNTSVLQGIINGSATHLGIRIQDNDGQEVGTHEASDFVPPGYLSPAPLPVLDLMFV